MGKHMDVKRTLNAGDKGTQKYLNEFGDKLVNVRYREDKSGNMRYTTVELIVDSKPIAKVDEQLVSNTRLMNEYVFIRVDLDEVELRDKIKRFGAVWNENCKLWSISLLTTLQLGLTDRIVKSCG